MRGESNHVTISKAGGGTREPGEGGGEGPAGYKGGQGPAGLEEAVQHEVL